MISFFGASITQQKKGYAFVLEKEYFTNERCCCHGFGGTHLSDAGIIGIQNVLVKKPKICFVDWFTTAYQTDNFYELKLYLDTIVYAFSRAKCKLVFLFMPRFDHEKRLHFYALCKKYLQSNNLSFIDVTKGCPFSQKTVRDTCHTTIYGGRVYAKYIYDEYTKIKNTIPIPPAHHFGPTKYSLIKHLHVDRVFDTKTPLTLYGNCEILGMLCTVGRHSGLVEVDLRNNNVRPGSITRIEEGWPDQKYIVSTWDKFCHYSRNHFLLRQNINGYVHFTVLPNTFDTSLCRRANIDFTKYRKKLVVIQIYYIGESLKLS